MAPIHTILHPTDFSDRSRFALQMAAALARDYAARLVIVHVATPTPVVYGEGVVPVQPDDYKDELRSHLNTLQVEGGEIHAERLLVDGDPATEILRLAGEMNADLVVMGTHGRTGLSRLLMGSVAEQVVRRVDCPVLTVKAFAPVVTQKANAQEARIPQGLVSAQEV